jgi:hypothetical protein
MGDDGAVGLDTKPKLQYIKDRYSRLGMSIEIKERDGLYNGLTYCSKYIWNVGGHPTAGPYGARQFCKFGIDFANIHPNLYKPRLLGAAKSMLPEGGHVPVWGDFLRSIIRTGEEAGIKPRFDNRDLHPGRMRGGVVLEPTVETCVQFGELYGFNLETVYLLRLTASRISIHDLPMQLTGDLINQMIEVDLGSAPNTEDICVYNEVVDKIPHDEEIAKLEAGKGNWMATLQAAAEHGKEEVQHGAPMFHIPLHVFFTSISYWCLPIGIAFHRSFNRLQMYRGGLPAAKKRIQQSGRKKNKQFIPRAPPVHKIPMDPFIIANSNPFAPEAVGARMPDDIAYESIAMTLSEVFEIIVDANGYAGFCCRGDFVDFFCTPDSISAAGVSTWYNVSLTGLTGDFTQKPASIDFPAGRFVGGGVKMSYESKDADVSGELIMGYGPDILDSTTDLGYSYWPNSRTDISHLVGKHNLTLKQLTKEPHIMKHKMVTNNHPYHSWTPSLQNANVDERGASAVAPWANLYCFIEGAPASAVINVEVIAHIEVLSNSSNPSYVKPKIPPMDNPKAMTIVKKMHTHNQMVPLSRADNHARGDLRSAIQDVTGVAVDVGKGFVINGLKDLATDAVGWLAENGIAAIGSLFL